MGIVEILLIIFVGLPIANGLGNGLGYIIKETKKCNLKGQQGLIRNGSVVCADDYNSREKGGSIEN